MKHFNILFRVSLWAILLSLTCTSAKADEGESAPGVDSVEISLLTCGPGHEVYSLYGHTALRYNDHRTGEDWVVNYGMFSFRQRFFILRFVFGLTDYEMGIVPFRDFMAEYRAEGRWVYQQTLNLSVADRLAVRTALQDNYREENRTYRYNFFYNNCTTKARDLIIDHIYNKVEFPAPSNAGITYRSMIHEWNGDSPWCRLGNDLLLGVKADREVTTRDRQFLPDSLRKSFAGAKIVLPTGRLVPLVSKGEMLYQPGATVADESCGLTPLGCSLLLLAVVLGVSLAEYYTHKIYWVFDGLWLLADGVAGLILVLMIFSQHPTVSLNFQIFCLCPWSLVALWPALRNLYKHKWSNGLYVLQALLALSLFLGIWQHYDSSIYIVALSLLLRLMVLHHWCKRKRVK